MGWRGGRRKRPPSVPWLIALAVALQIGIARADELPPVAVVGDTIPRSLTGRPGNPAHGRTLVVDRQRGLCLLCHTGPFPEERFQGTLAPDLGGAGTRWSEGQLRLRLVDSSQLNPATIMPSYYRTEGLTRVARAWEGKPVLTGQEIEDVISFLQTLK